MDNTRDCFSNAVKIAAESLFKTTEPVFSLGDVEPGSGCNFAALVGYMGTEIRGIFAVSMWGDSIERDRGNLYRDWVGELANQLAGRVDNQMARYGIKFDVTPPIIIRGEVLGSAIKGAATSLTFTSSSGTCGVWALLDVLEEAEINPTTIEDQLAEGEIVLF